MDDATADSEWRMRSVWRASLHSKHLMSWHWSAKMVGDAFRTHDASDPPGMAGDIRSDNDARDPRSGRKTLTAWELPSSSRALVRQRMGNSRHSRHESVAEIDAEAAL